MRFNPGRLTGLPRGRIGSHGAFDFGGPSPGTGCLRRVLDQVSGTGKGGESTVALSGNQPARERLRELRRNA